MSAIHMSMNTIGESAVLNAKTGEPPVLKGVEVKGLVTGLLFDVRVEQRYVNASAENIEAVYTFPLPWGAVLLGMEFVIGNRTLRGEVTPAADSEQRYESAIERGDTVIMLERAADGLYTVNIGNLLAKEVATVRFQYAMLLSFEQGRVRMAIPTVIAPRYGSPTLAHLRAHQVPSSAMLADYSCDVSVVLTGALQRGRISSPSHGLAVRQGESGIEVSLAKTGRMDRDFVLVVDELEGSSLAVIGDDGDEQVALVSFCPRMTEPLYPSPISIKILVDCSGSMNGDSMASARRALHEILQQLIPADRFSFSRFGSHVVHHSKTLLPASSRALREGADWIAATLADMGGTEMAKALRSTFELCRPHAADILLITDGEVWEVDQLVTDAASSGQRIFAVDIGSAPAASLLHTLASRSGGACEFVGVNDDIHGAVIRMFRRIRQAPVKELALRWDASTSWRCDPGNVVFSGETVHAFAGFAGARPTTAVMEWSQTNGADSSVLAVKIDGPKVAGNSLARVAAMMRYPSMGKTEQHALAMKYQLVTESTNLLVVLERSEHDKPACLPALHIVSQMAAAGWGGAGSVATEREIVRSAPVAVWRRESASDHVRFAAETSMESYDIPAFLRKRIEPIISESHSRTPDEGAALGTKPHAAFDFLYRDDLIDFLRCIDSGQNRALNSGGMYPGTFAQLAGQVPSALMQALLIIREDGYRDDDIIAALFVTISDYREELRISQRLYLHLQALKERPTANPELYVRLRSVLEVLVAYKEPSRWNESIPPRLPSRSVFSWFSRKRKDTGVLAFLREGAD